MHEIKAECQTVSELQRLMEIMAHLRALKDARGTRSKRMKH
jgi:hypothetical protein